MNSIITFENVSEAICCEGELKKRGIKIKLIPTPRRLSASCGISARIASEDREISLKFLNDAKIPYEGCYDDLEK